MSQTYRSWTDARRGTISMKKGEALTCASRELAKKREINDRDRQQHQKIKSSTTQIFLDPLEYRARMADLELKPQHHKAKNKNAMNRGK